MIRPVVGTCTSTPWYTWRAAQTQAPDRFETGAAKHLRHVCKARTRVAVAGCDRHGTLSTCLRGDSWRARRSARHRVSTDVHTRRRHGVQRRAPQLQMTKTIRPTLNRTAGCPRENRLSNVQQRPPTRVGAQRQHSSHSNMHKYAVHHDDGGENQGARDAGTATHSAPAMAPTSIPPPENMIRLLTANNVPNRRACVWLLQAAHAPHRASRTPAHTCSY